MGVLVATMLSEREKTVLETIIRSYVKAAEPVSSRYICDHTDIDASPATVRGIMATLEDRNYLFQPHTSAGRVPTQKGYRFFVDHCIREEELPRNMEASIRRADDWHDILELIARSTHLFAAASIRGQNTLINFGMGEVLQRPEFRNHDLAQRFGTLIDALFEKHDDYESLLEEDEPHVFIEEENPIPEANFVSVVASPAPEAEGVILVIGPTRMDYEGASNILRNLSGMNIRL